MARPSVRGKLIEGALETFQARGFNGCSVQDIVDAAGVPKGSFYNHFKTKESLALEALTLYEKGSCLELLADKKRAPLKRIRGHFEALAAKLSKLGYTRGCLLGMFGAELSDSNGGLREGVADGLRNWSRALAEVLREAQASGELSAKRDPARLGRFLVNAWQGAVARAKIARSQKPLDEFFAVAFEELLV